MYVARQLTVECPFLPAPVYIAPSLRQIVSPLAGGIRVWVVDGELEWCFTALRSHYLRLLVVP